MAGGLLNIVSVGNNNQFLTGNPCKTFFKVTYSKYTNFGLQKFRLDYSGLRELRLKESSVFSFKMSRYADLLMDTYLVVKLPDIWSPVWPPTTETTLRWVPYDFKWIENIGCQIIEEIEITCGSVVLQRFSGEYLAAMIERDFSTEKKKLFNEMSGNINECNDPANAFGRSKTYPSAQYTSSALGAEPSIRGRNIYVPINTWFTMNSKCAFPLVSLQYNELQIKVTLRPIQDLFVVRDPYDPDNNFPYVRPDFTQDRFQMYRFLQTPPRTFIQPDQYENKISNWDADVHLISTYCFLSEEEIRKFTMQDQVYLIKDIYQYTFQNITGSKRLKVETNGMVSSWMWYMQRNDVKFRNQWSNYSNWPYHYLPMNITLADITIPSDVTAVDVSYGLGIHPNTTSAVNSGIAVTGDFQTVNRKEILESFGILLNGEYRENMFHRGIYDYIEKYTRTPGYAKEGLYCYNFCLNTDAQEYQPSGAINMNKFKNIELEVNTYIPTVDASNSNLNIVCDLCGNVVGIRKANFQLYDYNYNLTLFEERYNVLSFIGGNCGMMYSR
jgi:hypothetical protein|uniref:Major capsid protein N-terminal domain-containing protein n=1 Tax=viral metagenome TaxID=1070528 RepID=A0A6C0IP46_9ZZZZ